MFSLLSYSKFFLHNSSVNLNEELRENKEIVNLIDYMMKDNKFVLIDFNDNKFLVIRKLFTHLKYARNDRMI